MIGVRRLYLDTNVFIAMAEAADAISHKLSELVGMQMPGGEFLCTSELSLAELLVRPLQTEDAVLIQVYQRWMGSSDWLTVGPVDRAALFGAAQTRARHPGLKLPDAIHVSTAFCFGCSHFLTRTRGYLDVLSRGTTRKTRCRSV